ncbi:hypothetical protein Tco_0713643 [Tanacetum coccineum]
MSNKVPGEFRKMCIWEVRRHVSGCQKTAVLLTEGNMECRTNKGSCCVIDIPLFLKVVLKSETVADNLTRPRVTLDKASTSLFYAPPSKPTRPEASVLMVVVESWYGRARTWGWVMAFLSWLKEISVSSV